MWPDRCRADIGEDWACSEIIGDQCEAWGDHRRCLPAQCAWAARWHEPVRRAGMEAARSAGVAWAVVSTIGDRLAVVGTEDHLGRAKSLLRTGALKRAGLPTDYTGKGLVIVVRGSDGGLF